MQFSAPAPAQCLVDPLGEQFAAQIDAFGAQGLNLYWRNCYSFVGYASSLLGVESARRPLA